MTPKMVSALSAIAGIILCFLGHYYLGGIVLVAAFFLWFIDGLTI